MFFQYSDSSEDISHEKWKKNVWTFHFFQLWFKFKLCKLTFLKNFILTRKYANSVSHSILVLLQATTLNVAINSSNKALLTIMMSNNVCNEYFFFVYVQNNSTIVLFQFVELKGSVFRKFDKNNLFQLSCSDVRERFHLTMLLLAVSLQTMKEYAWRSDRLAVLLPDCIMLWIAEIIVDWVGFRQIDL